MSKSFTSDKLDWLNALMSDGKISSTAFRVGFCIAKHINQHTGITFVSDETIGDETNISRRRIIEARNLLKNEGWVIWKRTRTANVYRLLSDNLNAILDEQIKKSDLREERRLARRVVPKLTHLKSPVVPISSQHDALKTAQQDMPESAHIHLMGYTVEVTPKERGQPSKDSQLLRESIDLNIVTSVGTC